MRIALIPLDERPVNVDIPRQVAAIAGAEVILPDADAMPKFRVPASAPLISSWLDSVTSSGDVSHVVVCVDTLLYGGILAGRITHDSVGDVVGRLDLLREVKARKPQLGILAASLVMRASDSYSAVEEPDYWARYGRELHALGNSLHHILVDEAVERTSRPLVPVLPDDVVHDFELRRLRNHIVNLASIGLREEGVIDFLAITADDTAPFSAGSLEQLWLQHWRRALPSGNSILMYPGADEVGAVLVARALTSGLTSPRFRILCGESGGLERVPNFENVPLTTSVARQIRAAGAEIVDDSSAEIALVIHAPDPRRRDATSRDLSPNPEAVESTITEIRTALADGLFVALADVRYSNGSDPDLVDRLRDEGLLLHLAAYGGWNTAGNTIGSTVAAVTAVWAGTKRGTLSRTAVRRALLTRVLDDRAYQSGIRFNLDKELFEQDSGPADDATVLRASARTEEFLQAYLDGVTAGTTAWKVSGVHLPWSRSFEIGFRLDPAT